MNAEPSTSGSARRRQARSRDWPPPQRAGRRGSISRRWSAGTWTDFGPGSGCGEAGLGRADVAGFGSHLTWNLEGELVLMASPPWTIGAGWRHTDIDYDNAGEGIESAKRVRRHLDEFLKPFRVTRGEGLAAARAALGGPAKGASQ
jgi:hypothetical protein